MNDNSLITTGTVATNSRTAFLSLITLARYSILLNPISGLLWTDCRILVSLQGQSHRVQETGVLIRLWTARFGVEIPAGSKGLFLLQNVWNGFGLTCPPTERVAKVIRD